MSRVYVHGVGAVSPAGWGRTQLAEALKANTVVATKPLARPGWEQSLTVRGVPPANPRPAFLANPRLRRTSPISQYAMASALEALGTDAERVAKGEVKLGIVMCVMSGCVNYSRRFYDEALRDPATASPLVFPETVFNAPASHIAAVLGTTAINYTLVGDPALYGQGMALAADWLADGRVDGCLVIGAEELDWLTAGAFRLFSRDMVLAEGAGAVYLRNQPADAEPKVQLAAVTSPRLYTSGMARRNAVKHVASELAALGTADLFFDGVQGAMRPDGPELAVTLNPATRRHSVKRVLGDGLAAAAAWQCAAAIEALRADGSATADVLLAGCNEQAIGVRFARTA